MKSCKPYCQFEVNRQFDQCHIRQIFSNIPQKMNDKKTSVGIGHEMLLSTTKNWCNTFVTMIFMLLHRSLPFLRPCWVSDFILPQLLKQVETSRLIYKGAGGIVQLGEGLISMVLGFKHHHTIFSQRNTGVTSQFRGSV